MSMAVSSRFSCTSVNYYVHYPTIVLIFLVPLLSFRVDTNVLVIDGWGGNDAAIFEKRVSLLKSLDQG